MGCRGDLANAEFDILSVRFAITLNRFESRKPVFSVVKAEAWCVGRGSLSKRRGDPSQVDTLGGRAAVLLIALTSVVLREVNVRRNTLLSLSRYLYKFQLGDQIGRAEWRIPPHERTINDPLRLAHKGRVLPIAAIRGAGCV